ncbi:hypothetical protein EAF00_005862 [Botryotinia globosa]|nr:hypothetical protein EAF00_005862 [Botryotinia globosa]
MNDAINPSTPRKRIMVTMTSSTGACLGIKVLIALRRLNVETHLVLNAPVSSGSFHADGMIIIPCSMKTLAAISSGYCEDLISRAADVMLNERRRLVLAVRETPLSEIHMKNMMTVTRAGAIICPQTPAFNTRPSSIDDLVDQMVGRCLDLFGLDTGDFKRWNGPPMSK